MDLLLLGGGFGQVLHVIVQFLGHFFVGTCEFPDFRGKIDVLVAFLQGVVDSFVNVRISPECLGDFAHALDRLCDGAFHVVEEPE